MKKFFKLLRDGILLSLFNILGLASIVFGVSELCEMFSSIGLSVVVKLATFLIYTAIGIATLCFFGYMVKDE